MASELSMNGRKKIETLQKEFTQKFPYLTLVFLDKERRAIDISKSLSEVRQAKGEDISIKASLKVNTLEKRFLENFGLVVEVAYQKSNKVVYTKDNVDKTLNELNKWCQENDCQPFEFKKSFTGNTLSSVQEQLFEAIKEYYPAAEAKKINKDNYLDIYVPEINKKRGTHLFFNTAKDGIKIGFYCRDEEFIEEVLSRSSNIEKYAQGIRILNNPLQNDVEEATTIALSFIEEITGEQKNNSGEEDDLDLDEILRDLGYGDDEDSDSDEDTISLKVGDKVDGSMFLKTANVDFWLGDYKEKFIKEIFYSDDNEKYLAIITDNNGNVIDYWDIEALNTQFISSYKISIKKDEIDYDEDEIDEDALSDSNEIDMEVYDLDEEAFINNAIKKIKQNKTLPHLPYINETLIAKGYEIDKHTAFFFTSNVFVGNIEPTANLFVNMDGFHSDCIEEKFQCIFSWDSLIDIVVVNEEENSITINLVAKEGELTICEPFSKNILVLLEIYKSVWKNINKKFANEPIIIWGEVERMGVNLLSFETHKEYLEWINS